MTWQKKYVTKIKLLTESIKLIERNNKQHEWQIIIISILALASSLLGWTVAGWRAKDAKVTETEVRVTKIDMDQGKRDIILRITVNVFVSSEGEVFSCVVNA